MMVKKPSVLKYMLLSVAMIAGIWTTGAQSKRVRLSSLTLTLEQALGQVKKQTGIGFAYNGRLFDVKRTITFLSVDMTVDQVLEKLTEGTNFTYAYMGNMVSIVKKPERTDTPVVAEELPDNGYIRSRESDFDDPAGRRERNKIQVQPQMQPRIIMTYQERQPEIHGEFQSNYTDLREYAANQNSLPRFGIKTNLLYGAAAFTPNIAVEAGLGMKTSFHFSAGYNPWKTSRSQDKGDRQLVHMTLLPEMRWWTCERFNGHFFSLHGIYAKYNISGMKVPGLFEKRYRYKGSAIGGGIGYGYHWAFSRRWGVEFNISAGVLVLDHTRTDCAVCNRNPVKQTKTYFGVTNAGVSMVFLLK